MLVVVVVVVEEASGGGGGGGGRGADMGDGWPVVAAALSSVFMRRSSLMAYHPSAAIDYL